MVLLQKREIIEPAKNVAYVHREAGRPVARRLHNGGVRVLASPQGEKFKLKAHEKSLNLIAVI